jgi:hypothetical protein
VDEFFNGTVLPHWIGRTERFWYERLRDGQRVLRVVDAAAGRPCLDVPIGDVAQALAAALKAPVATDTLLLQGLRFDDDLRRLGLTTAGDPAGTNGFVRNLLLDAILERRPGLARPAGGGARLYRDRPGAGVSGGQCGVARARAYRHGMVAAPEGSGQGR